MVSSEPFQPPVVTNERIKEFRNTYPDFDRASETTIRNRIRWMAKKDWENRLINSNGPAEMGSQDPQPQVRRAGMFNGDEELEDIISSRCRTDEEYVRMLGIDLIRGQFWWSQAVAVPTFPFPLTTTSLSSIGNGRELSSTSGPLFNCLLNFLFNPLIPIPLTAVVRAGQSVPNPVVRVEPSTSTLPTIMIRAGQSVPNPVVQAEP